MLMVIRQLVLITVNEHRGTRNSRQTGRNGPSPRSATRDGVVTKMAENWRVATSIDTNAW